MYVQTLCNTDYHGKLSLVHCKAKVKALACRLPALEIYLCYVECNLSGDEGPRPGGVVEGDVTATRSKMGSPLSIMPETNSWMG